MVERRGQCLAGTSGLAVGRRGQDESRLLVLGQLQRAPRALARSVEPLAGWVEGARRREVEDVAHAAWHPERLGQVAPYQLEVGPGGQMGDVADVPVGEVVDADHGVVLAEQSLTQMRTEEAGASGHYRAP